MSEFASSRWGTVYGTLLNHVDALAALGDQVNAAPYQAPPRAPILYIKPRNTLAAHGAPVVVPADIETVEIGGFFDVIRRAAEGWDGVDPVRTVG